MEESGGGSAAGAIVGLLVLVIELAIFAVMIAGMWKLFVKAGQPGWAAIVPIYNTYVMTQIVGRPILWFILTFVPCVNFVALVLIMIDLAKSFGKSTGYAIGDPAAVRVHSHARLRRRAVLGPVVQGLSAPSF